MKRKQKYVLIVLQNWFYTALWNISPFVEKFVIPVLFTDISGMKPTFSRPWNRIIPWFPPPTHPPQSNNWWCCFEEFYHIHIFWCDLTFKSKIFCSILKASWHWTLSPPQNPVTYSLLNETVAWLLPTLLLRGENGPLYSFLIRQWLQKDFHLPCILKNGNL